jgi:hypothetical protein
MQQPAFDYVNVPLALPHEAAQTLARLLGMAGVSCFECWGARSPGEAEEMMRAAWIMRSQFTAHGIYAGQGGA